MNPHKEISLQLDRQKQAKEQAKQQRDAERAFKAFEKDQTLTNLNELRILGIELRELKGGKWVRLGTYSLPFGRMVRLYDDNLLFVQLGVY